MHGVGLGGARIAVGKVVLLCGHGDGAAADEGGARGEEEQARGEGDRGVQPGAEAGQEGGPTC